MARHVVNAEHQLLHGGPDVPSSLGLRHDQLRVRVLGHVEAFQFRNGQLGVQLFPRSQRDEEGFQPVEC